MRAIFGTIVLACAVAACVTAFALPAAQGEATVIYLVRHAEEHPDSEDDGPKGPTLTGEGRARAELLARMLRAEPIDHVHSSNYFRTLQTARPLAERLGLDVELYDPRRLEILASTLKKAGGRHVVLGHSNTTPALVKLLGGDPGDPIHEPSEFDRIYAVVLGETGGVTTLRLRYGDPPSGR